MNEDHFEINKLQDKEKRFHNRRRSDHLEEILLKVAERMTTMEGRADKFSENIRMILAFCAGLVFSKSGGVDHLLKILAFLQ